MGWAMNRLSIKSRTARVSGSSSEFSPLVMFRTHATIWKYREDLTNKGAYDKLFKDFDAYLDSLGLIVNEGKIIDASFVVAPRQRNTPEENRKIKEGKGDELWNDNPNKKRHKDVDARWTKKRDENYYGYKNHAKVCKKAKLIRSYDTMPASVHDSGRSASLISPTISPVLLRFSNTIKTG